MIAGSVFISYNVSDARVAWRIYSDLERLGAHPWRFERDGVRGVDFMEEALERIRSSAVFCLLDSPASRESPSVRDECAEAVRSLNATGRPTIQVCSLVPLGPWRGVELFERQNGIASIDFSSYTPGIRSLCRALGTTYVPAFTNPRDLEFVEELARSTIPGAECDRLAEAYQSYRTCYEANRVEDAVAGLRTLRLRLESLGVVLVSPLLALGVLYADQGEDREAEDVFRELSERVSHDARGWGGLAGSLFFQGDYDGAAAAYEVCLRAIEASQRPGDLAELGQVRMNRAEALLMAGRDVEVLSCLEDAGSGAAVATLRARALLALGHAERAWAGVRPWWRRVTIEDGLPAQFFIVCADALAAMGDEPEEGRVLRAGLDRLPLDPRLQRRTALHYARWGAFDAAVDHLETALRLSPGSLAIGAELSMLYSLSGCATAAADMRRLLVRRHASNAEDHYYLGLVHWLSGNELLAEAELLSARTDRRLATWPPYEQLVGPRLLPRHARRETKA